MGSNLDDLEIINEIKQEFVDKIQEKEFERKIILNEALELGIIEHKIESLSQLEDLCIKYERVNDVEYFSEFSDLLKKIMKNLKDQNKRNQIFIQKALESLSSLRDDIAGNKSTQIYNTKGQTAVLRQSG